MSDAVTEFVDRMVAFSNHAADRAAWDASLVAWDARLEHSVRGRTEALESVRWLYVGSDAESSHDGGECSVKMVRRQISPRTRAIRRAARARRELAESSGVSQSEF